MPRSLLLYAVYFVLVGSQTVIGQYTASLNYNGRSGTGVPAAAVQWNDTLAVQRFPGRKTILPAAMVLYGVAGLKFGFVKDLNRHIQEGISVEDVHKRIHLDNYLQYAPAAAVYGLNLAGVKGKHNFADRTIIYGISKIVLMLAVPRVKKISKEMRPDGSDPYSFPSGHAAIAFAAAEFLRQEYKEVSPWYGVGGYAAAVATGYLRMYNNKHWLSDVAGGAGIGILSTSFAYGVYPFVKRLLPHRHSSTIILPVYMHRGGGVGIVQAL